MNQKETWSPKYALCMAAKKGRNSGSFCFAQKIHFFANDCSFQKDCFAAFEQRIVSGNVIHCIFSVKLWGTIVAIQVSKCFQMFYNAHTMLCEVDYFLSVFQFVHHQWLQACQTILVSQIKNSTSEPSESLTNYSQLWYISFCCLYTIFFLSGNKKASHFLPCSLLT